MDVMGDPPAPCYSPLSGEQYRSNRLSPVETLLSAPSLISRRFLQDEDGDLYKQYRSKIEWLRHGFKEEGKGWCHDLLEKPHRIVFHYVFQLGGRSPDGVTRTTG